MTDTVPGEGHTKGLSELLKFVRATITLMRESGSWDAATMTRVDENIGVAIDQYLAASPQTWGEWERAQQESERK